MSWLWDWSVGKKSGEGAGDGSGSIQGGGDGLLVGESHEGLEREESTTMKQEHADEANAFFETATLRGTTVNVINTVIGAGVLALPYAIRLGGIAGGTTAVIAAAVLGERTAYFLLYCADHTRSRIYAQIGDALVGRRFSWLVDVTILLQNWGLCISYVTVLGDIFPEVLTSFFPHSPPWVRDRTVVLVVISSLVYFPLSAMPSLEALRISSFLALLCIAVFVSTIVVVAGLASNDPSYRPPHTWHEPVRAGPTTFTNYLLCFPLLGSAYVAHNNILLLFAELRRQANPDRDSKWPNKIAKMMLSVRIGLFFCCSVYVVQSVSGYVLFRDRTLSDIFLNFSDKQFPWIVYVKIAYSFVIILSFPVIAFGLRKSIHSIAFGLRAPVTTWHRIGEAFVIVFVAALVGILVQNVSIVFGFTGAITAVNIMYVFPSALFLLLWYRARIGYYDEQGHVAQEFDTEAQTASDGRDSHDPKQDALLLDEPTSTSPPTPHTPGMEPLGKPGKVVAGAGKDITNAQVAIAAVAIVAGSLVSVSGIVANIISLTSNQTKN